MQLTIDNHLQTFVPLHTFRGHWKLPVEFGVGRFSPKDWDGLGKLDTAGNQALTMLRRHILQAVWPALKLDHLLQQSDSLAAVFRRELETSVNVHVHLRAVEIDFAVAGFHDVLQKMAYSLTRLHHMHRGAAAAIRAEFNPTVIYYEWLDSSARLAADTRVYAHNDTEFTVRVVYNAYGRVGLVVHVDGETHYLLDSTLACPASNYMQSLLVAVGEVVCAAFLRSLA